MRIKKSFAALVLGLAVIGCAKESDVSDLKGRVDTLEEKVDGIVKELNSVKADVTTIQQFVETIKAKGFVTSVVKNDVGVLVTVYKDGKEEKLSVQIDGKQGPEGPQGPQGPQGPEGNDGNDGHTPQISVIEEGGVLYWAVDGAILEVDGKKIAVYAEAPSFEVRDGHLYVTIGGKTEDLGSIVPETVTPAFTDVDVQEDKVVFTTGTGVTFELPLEKAFGLRFGQNRFSPKPGETFTVDYEVVAAIEGTEVEAVPVTTGYEASVLATDYKGGKIEITVPDPMDEGYVLVYADNLKGKTSIKKLTILEAEVFTVGDVAEVPSDGGEYTVSAITNIPFTVKVTEGAGWLTYVETKAPKLRTLTFAAEENNTIDSRFAKVEIVRADDETVVLETLEIYQSKGYAAKIGKTGYDTVQAAVDAAKEGETVNVAGGEILENVKIAKVVTLQGIGEATVLGSVEIMRAAATVKDLKVVGDPAVRMTADTYNRGLGNYPYCISVNVSGYGALIENVVIDMEKVIAASGTGLYIGTKDDDATAADVLKNSTLNGYNGRGVQAYNVVADFIGNTFTEPLNGGSKYNVRIGGTSKVTLSGNTFESATENVRGVDFNSLSGAVITLGDGVTDDNVFGENYAYKYTANAATTTASNTFAPEVAFDRIGEESNYAVKPVAAKIGDVKYFTIQAAIDAAEAGQTVNVLAGNHDEHLQIAKAITLAGVEGAVVNSVEIYKAAATVKDLTINVVAEEHLASLTAPGYKYTYGIYVHRAGYGALIDNVTINMENAKSDATGLFLVNSNDERGETYDIVQNSTINGVAGKRNAQIYAAKAKLTGNTFSGGHAGYGIRLGENVIDVILENNTFKEAAGAATAAIQLNTKFADGFLSFKGNTQDGSFKYLITGQNEWLITNNETHGIILGRANGASTEYVQKADGLATRAWGYFNSEGDWDDEMVTTRGEWNRSAVLTAAKVYIPIAGAAEGQYGVAVFGRKTGAYEETITAGFEDGGVFRTCGIAQLGDKIFVSNLARNGQELKVYELNTEAKSATKILSYVTTGTRDNAEQNLRLGDKMTSWGDLSAGVLGFTDYDGNGYVEFRIKDGVWDTAAKTSTGTFERKVAASQIGGIYWTTGHISSAYESGGGDRYGIYASNREVNFRMTYCYGQVDYLYGGTGYWLSTDYGLESNMMDPKWFWYSDGNKYLAYVSSTGTIGGRASGYLKIVKLTGDTWLKQLQGIPSATVVGVYPLGSATDIYATGNANTNQEGFCDVYNDGEGGVWIIAGLAECGISLFQMN